MIPIAEESSNSGLTSEVTALLLDDWSLRLALRCNWKFLFLIETIIIPKQTIPAATPKEMPKMRPIFDGVILALQFPEPSIPYPPLQTQFPL